MLPGTHSMVPVAIFTVSNPSPMLRSIINRFIGLTVILLLPLVCILAQTPAKIFPASLSLVHDNGQQVRGGILYEGDIVKGVISFDSKQWDGRSRFYCYVFFYSEGQDIALAYPLGDDPGANRFPHTNAAGALLPTTILFEGVISPPFGKDNFVLLMTENPIPNINSLLRYGKNAGEGDLKQELMRLIKGSKLSVFSEPSYGTVAISTMQIESRPAAEKSGLTKGNTSAKTVFALSDSSEIFYTPRPQNDIVRDSFPTVEIIDPSFDTTSMRGAKVLSVTTPQKILVRGIAANWKQGVNSIRSIQVNGQPAANFRANSGYFDYLYEPKEGLNIADVRVENEQGYARTIRLKFEYRQTGVSAKKKEGKDHLFVIGIDKYAEWSGLHNAARDAKDFRKLMMDQYGFKEDNVKDLFDEKASRKNIYNQLRSYVENLDEQDRLLVYFSGHGFYDSVLETGYWIPADAHSGADDEYLSNLDITRMLQKMKARNIFVIADACYSGQLLRDMQKENSGQYKSRMVLCSGKLKPVPDGVPGSNSPFAVQVLGFLRQTVTATVLASDLIQQVKRSFAGADGQKPVGGAIDEVGDENGDFVFRKGK